MGWTATLSMMAGALAVILVARKRAAEPVIPGRVRYVPWTALLFVSVLVALMMLAHMLTLAGLKRP